MYIGIEYGHGNIITFEEIGQDTVKNMDKSLLVAYIQYDIVVKKGKFKKLG